MRMDLVRGEGGKRRAPRNEPEQTVKETPPSTQTASSAPPRSEAEVDDKPIPDDLSEISDDPDDILNREDVSKEVCVLPHPISSTYTIPFKYINLFFTDD